MRWHNTYNQKKFAVRKGAEFVKGRSNMRKCKRSVKICIAKQEAEGLGINLRKKREAFANSKLINR